jgi:outer membrane protein OmpA-like peptidoglycan-associated protein
MYMKKNLSLAGYSLVALGLVMGSCVSKRKYMEAQTSAAERYRTDSTEWATRSATMQQNVSSLEQRNTTYQRELDSLRNASTTYQKHWDNLQTSYTTTSEQVHQQIHTAIDQYVEASNVQLQNGKVYVNLPEKMLFNAGSSTLSSKGKQALDKLAEVLATNQNVEVDIIATSAYYNDGTGTAGTGSTGTGTTGTERNNVTGDNTTGTETTGSGTTGSGTTGSGTTGSETTRSTTDANTDAPATTGTGNKSTAKNKNATANNNKTARSNQSSANKNQSSANVGDSSFPSSGAVTDRRTQQDPNKKNQGTTKARTTQKGTTTAAKSTKSKQGDQSMSFKSSPKGTKATASTAPNWNLNVARSTAIVRQLTQNGLPQARIILAGHNAKGITTNEWASTNRGYQIVVSPKMDYQQMWQQRQGTGSGQGTTSMK